MRDRVNRATGYHTTLSPNDDDDDDDEFKRRKRRIGQNKGEERGVKRPRIPFISCKVVSDKITWKQ